LFELAREKDRIEPVQEQLHRLGSVFDQDQRFRLFLDTPMVSGRQRWQFFQQTLTGWADQLLMGLLAVLVRRNRTGLLRRIVEAFDACVDEYAGRVPMTLITAQPLLNHQLLRLEEVLQRFTGKQPILHVSVDESLLGGFIVRVGDLQIDGSVRRKLQRWRQQLLMRGEDELQSGRDFIGH